MSAIHTRKVACGDMPAFLALPASEAKAPAVIVMHERYGLVRHTCDLAERFARDGYVAIAPDFYFQHPDQEALHRGDVGHDMSDPDALVRLEAAIAALAAVPPAGLGRRALMGIFQNARPPPLPAASAPPHAGPGG